MGKGIAFKENRKFLECRWVGKLHSLTKRNMETTLRYIVNSKVELNLIIYDKSKNTFPHKTGKTIL